MGADCSQMSLSRVYWIINSNLGHINPSQVFQVSFVPPGFKMCTHIFFWLDVDPAHCSDLPLKWKAAKLWTSWAERDQALLKQRLRSWEAAASFINLPFCTACRCHLVPQQKNLWLWALDRLMFLWEETRRHRLKTNNRMLNISQEAMRPIVRSQSVII